MKAKLGQILIFGIIHIGNAWAYEVDDFTDRNLPRQDATAVMDREVNSILDRAVKATNAESKNYCSFAHLRQEILRWIRPDPAGILEIWANNTNQIQQTRTTFRNSIYGDVTFFDSPALWIVGIGSSMRLGNQSVGTDKIGHFFMQGLGYFDRVRDGKKLNQVLIEDHGEDGVWGMTGVKSYADMSANYSGYLFWSHLTQEDDRYFKCVYGQGWVKVRSFTWADYVTDAWDEGINCSEMSDKVQRKVTQRFQKMGLQCPVDLNRCKGLAKQDHAQHLISPKCLTAASN